MLHPGASPACVVAALAMLASACSTPRTPSASQDIKPRNLLLVTIDTLRADRVGVYGHAPARTPAMDALARGGLRFARAYAAAPITLTSHATLLTGVNPAGHGARHNGMHVRDTVPTLGTWLHDAGFATAAFVSAFPLDRRFGLERGFTTYDDGLPRREDGRPGDERAGAITIGAARAWLDANRDKPFFLWAHLFEPHAPYGDPASPEAASPAPERYDREIAEADRQLARLIDGLGTARASTLIVVAGDHGEAFGEHGELAHSIFVYDTTLRVPLIFNGPGVPADGRTIDAAVGLVDVAPTLLGLLGQPVVSGDGVDLRPLMAGTSSSGARTLYAESFAPLVDFGWSPLRSVREGRWKYVAAPRPELFDLEADPAEEHDLIAEHADVASPLAGKIDAISPASLAQPVARDRETTARLGSLGYVALTAGGRDGARPDPKDRREMAARIAQVTSGQLPPDRLVPALDALVAEDPQNGYLRLRLGAALAERGDCDPAEKHLQAAVRAGVPTADPFLSLAYCYRQRGAAAAAERALLSADRAEPGNPVVAANLGLIAFDAGRLRDAVPRLEAAVTRDPDLHMARFFLARAYARLGNRQAAQEQAATLLSRLPPSAPQRAEVERLVATLADQSPK
jgi:arylsulfatase A-like enzyme/Tfp pilus assembly protein PilF